MYFQIKKNIGNTWAITPTSGQFAGFVIATAEGIDMTSVVVAPGQVLGAIKALWGVQFDPGLDVYSDMETIRALCLGKAFKGEVDQPVAWESDGLYDINSNTIVRRCKRLVMLGSSIFRRD